MLLQIIQLGFFTLLAWLLHAGLVTLYTRWFASTKLVSFRLLHMVEIGVSIALGMLLYLALANKPVSAGVAVVIVLGVLVVVDLLLFGLLSPNFLKSFDVWHFAAAYTTVTIATYLVFSR